MSIKLCRNINTFANCDSLTSIVIPKSVTSIGEDAFWGCRSLTSITIPESVTSIGSGAFSDCSSLESIVVDEGNKIYHSDGNCLIKTDSETLIAGCKNSIIPSDGSITSIGEYAFDGCKSLTNITIPDSVTSIKSISSFIFIGAFYNCSSLTSINFQGSMKQWKAIDKESLWNYGTGSYTVTCTDGVLDKSGDQK